MGHQSRAHRPGFRRAVVGSVAVHVLAAVAFFVVLRPGKPAGSRAGPETRVHDVVVSLAPEPIADPVPIALPDASPPPAPPAGPEPVPPQPTHSPQPPSPPGGTPTARPPTVGPAPNPLPAGIVSFIRRPRSTPPSGAVPAMHGAMRAGQTVVYAIDCSGSMGEFGKFAAARAVLVATLSRQPGEVRFQVIAYNTVARAVLPGGCVAAGPASVAAVERGLAALSPAGRSNHAEAVRAAAALRPDVVVLLTDAEDLAASQLKPLLAGAGRPVAVCVARVSAAGVGEPRELR